MPRLLITYSLSYDWLVRGRPDEDWRPALERGLAYRDTARRQWARHEPVVFAAFESFGLRFWEAWPAYAVHLPPGVPAFKEPLTFPISDEWEEVFTALVHELGHLHEDHPANASRYAPVVAHVRDRFRGEAEDVRCHVVTCIVQRAVLMRAFPGTWPALVNRAGKTDGHPVLTRTWQLICEREGSIHWSDPLASVLRL